MSREGTCRKGSDRIYEPKTEAGEGPQVLTQSRRGRRNTIGFNLPAEHMERIFIESFFACHAQKQLVACHTTSTSFGRPN